MFISKFLGLGGFLSMIEKWAKDPAEEVYALAQGMFFGYIRSYFLSALVILIVLGIFGFSSLGGGPFSVAEILFYVTLVFLIIISLVFWMIWRKVHSYIKKASEKYKSNIARTVDYQEIDFLK